MAEQAEDGAADLVQLWEEHIRHEFSTRNTDETLKTMVEDAYVDHVPVLTGGSGQAELREFYATHFIPKMPPDMEMVPVSRTVGSDQLVDEMVIKFTHSIEMELDAARHPADWSASRSFIGGDRPISGRQTGSRAYLLGPGLGACPNRLTRFGKAAGIWSRERPKGSRSRGAREFAYQTCNQRKGRALGPVRLLGTRRPNCGYRLDQSSRS